MQPLHTDASQLEGGGQLLRNASALAAGDGSEDKQPLHIDGSQLVGGGQLLRNASALAAITGTPIAIDKIRAGRSNPGLRPQHLSGLRLTAALSGGALEGGAVKSTAVALRPGRLAAGAHVADTGTAGSCMLLAQAALPCLLFAAPGPAGGGRESVLELRGGTDATLAPPLGYLQHVLLPVLGALGVDATVELVRRGFFPRGGGVVSLRAEALPAGGTLPALTLTQRGRVTRICIRAFTAGKVGAAVGESMARAAEAGAAQGASVSLPFAFSCLPGVSDALWAPPPAAC